MTEQMTQQLSLKNILDRFVHDDPSNIFLLSDFLTEDKMETFTQIFNTRTYDEFDRIDDNTVVGLYYHLYNSPGLSYKYLKSGVGIDRNFVGLNYIMRNEIFKAVLTYNNTNSKVQKTNTLSSIRKYIRKLPEKKNRVYFYGMLYEQLGNTELSLYCFLESASLGQNEAYNDLYSIYIQRKNYEKALFYALKYFCHNSIHEFIFEHGLEENETLLNYFYMLGEIITQYKPKAKKMIKKHNMKYNPLLTLFFTPAEIKSMFSKKMFKKHFHQEECCICYEEVDYQCQYECGHSVCYDCDKQIDSFECPYCRFQYIKSFKTDEYYYDD